MSTRRTQPLGDVVGRHRISLYLVLAYALSWSIWPLVLMNPESSPMMPFGPSIAAIVVATASGGRRELAALLRGLTHFRTAPRWYVAAVVLPAGILAATFGVALSQGATVPQWDASHLVQLLTTLATTVILVGLFEELGWRGFLLPLVQRRYGALAGSIAVAMAWVPWHLPELISDASQRPVIQFVILLTAQSVLLAWLYNRTTGSLPVVILFHASFNSFAQFLLVGLDGEHYQTAWWVMAVLTSAAALVAARYLAVTLNTDPSAIPQATRSGLNR